MKSPICGGIIVFAVALLAPKIVQAQGFLNLNFESGAVVPAFPPSTSPISASSAIPGWTAYNSGSAQSFIGYDSFSLGGSLVNLEDTNAPNSSPVGFGLRPIQGSYSVLLQGPSPGIETSAAIGQTGTIPITAQSLIFWGILAGNLQVTFNGQPLSFMEISNALNYTVWGANISAYAGQTGQLLFTAPVLHAALIDNIQFSSVVVPEPSEFALAALGTLLLGFRPRKSNAVQRNCSVGALRR